MNRRFVVLDYTGTLDTVSDPVAFVRALQAQGDFVISWTGASQTLEEKTPGLRDAVNAVLEKPSGLPDQLQKIPEVPSSVVVCDDSKDIRGLCKMWSRRRAEPWHILHEGQIQTLII